MDNLTETIRVRVSADDKRKCERLAKEAGVNVSAWVRVVLRERLATKKTERAEMMTLTGMFFHRDGGEYYTTGEIIRQVHPDAYLARLDCSITEMPVNPLVLFTVTYDMAETDDDCSPQFRFFETRADLQTWLNWANAPVENKEAVVKLVKKEKTH